MASVASPLDRRPLTLHKCCIKVIRRTIGLARLESVTGLALPAAISSEITSLCLNDFEIDKDAVAHGSDEFPSFPATCLIDGSQVYVMVFEEENQRRPPDDPSLLTSFLCHSITCCIYEKTTTLAEKINKTYESNETFTEQLIWTIIDLLVSEPNDSRSDEVKLIPQHIHFTSTDKMFLRNGGKRAVHTNTGNVGIYDAPEMIFSKYRNHENTTSWAIGCIAYEMCTLAPAFGYESDQDSENAKLRILDGNVAPILSSNFTEELKQVIYQCLKVNADERPTLKQIKQTTKNKIEI